jgi:hypothetical protein
LEVQNQHGVTTSPWIASPNLSTFGSSCKMCTSMRMYMMTFFWKLTGNGRYSSKSAHEVKFLGGKFGLLLRNFFFRLAPNAKSDLDRPWTVYKSGVGQLWLVPFLQANDGIGLPLFCQLPLHRPYLKLHMSLDGHLRHTTKPLGRSINQALVENHDERIHAETQGLFT